MSDNMLNKEATRREFTAASVSALFVGMVVTMTGCGSGSSPYSPAAPTPSSTSPGSSTDKGATVSGNHGHVAVVTGAELLAGGNVSLSIQGTADHDHAVALTATQVAAVAAGTKISVTSAVGILGADPAYGIPGTSHDHVVTFN